MSALLLMVGVAIVIVSARRSAWLLRPLLVALAIRATAAVAHRLLMIIPQGRADAVRFERTAWEWAQSGCGNLGEHLNLSASYVHAWLVGNIYACTDRAPLLFQAINVLLGVLIVFLIACLALRLWGRAAALRAAWIAAMFPMLVIYAAVPLREVWFTAFLLLGAIWLVDWTQRGSVYYTGGAAVAFFIASIFHGGAFFALLAMAFTLMVWAVREILRCVSSGRLRTAIMSGALVISAAGAAGILTVGELRFSSIGDVSRIIEQLDTLEERTTRLARDGAAYPPYMIPSGDLDALALSLPRMAYLLVGPLPWDVRAPSHALGMLDGLFYLVVVILLWRYRAWWWHRRDFRILVFVVVALLLVYGWGTSNFGTGLRHRTKFAGLFIALAAGLLGRERWRQTRLEQLEKEDDIRSI